MGNCKCKFPDGVVIKPDGVHELDPCLYKDIEMVTNVNVVISRCTKCGHIDFEWHPTDETEHIILEDKD